MKAYPSTEWQASLDEEIALLRAEERRLLNLRAGEEAKRGVYRCAVCRENYVCPDDGQDTCDDCVRKV